MAKLFQTLIMFILLSLVFASPKMILPVDACSMVPPPSGQTRDFLYDFMLLDLEGNVLDLMTKDGWLDADCSVDHHHMIIENNVLMTGRPNDSPQIYQLTDTGFVGGDPTFNTSQPSLSLNGTNFNRFHMSSTQSYYYTKLPAILRLNLATQEQEILNHTDTILELVVKTYSDLNITWIYMENYLPVTSLDGNYVYSQLRLFVEDELNHYDNQFVLRFNLLSNQLHVYNLSGLDNFNTFESNYSFQFSVSADLNEVVIWNPNPYNFNDEYQFSETMAVVNFDENTTEYVTNKAFKSGNLHYSRLENPVIFDVHAIYYLNSDSMVMRYDRPSGNVSQFQSKGNTLLHSGDFIVLGSGRIELVGGFNSVNFVFSTFLFGLLITISVRVVGRRKTLSIDSTKMQTTVKGSN